MTSDSLALPEGLEAMLPPEPVAPVADVAWPPERIAAAESLWGAGFVQPGGPAEIKRLVNPLGLTSAATMLLLGGETGGPLRALAEMGPWMGCFEPDADLLAVATSRKLPNKLAKRVNLQTLDPLVPELQAGYFHHGLALQTFQFSRPETILAACEAALKTYGHLVVLDLVVDRPMAATDPLMLRWARAERRAMEVPMSTAVTRALTRLGFDVHVVEDLSQNHERQALAGWARRVRQLEQSRPGVAYAAALVQEAERWTLRLRLMQDGRLKLMRWHAVKSNRRAEAA